jgi:hypothetical protein
MAKARNGKQHAPYGTTALIAYNGKEPRNNSFGCAERCS